MSRRAKLAARDILKRYGYKLPLDVYAVARSYDINVQTQPMEDEVSCVLIIGEAGTVINVNGNHPPNQQRFSIAHSLGHYILHRDSSHAFIDMPARLSDKEGFAEEGRREAEASAFAAELMMPEMVLKEQVRHQPINIYSVTSLRPLAAQFGINELALAVRLTRLGLTQV